jgi:hypothetical protein
MRREEVVQQPTAAKAKSRAHARRRAMTPSARSAQMCWSRVIAASPVHGRYLLGRLLWLCRSALLSPYVGIIGPTGPIGQLFLRHQRIRACLGHPLARSSRPRRKLGPQNRATVGAGTGVGTLAARTRGPGLVRLARLARCLRHRPTRHVRATPGQGLHPLHLPGPQRAPPRRSPEVVRELPVGGRRHRQPRSLRGHDAGG